MTRVNAITDGLVLWSEQRNVCLLGRQFGDPIVRITAVLGVVISAPFARMIVIMEGNLRRCKFGDR